MVSVLRPGPVTVVHGKRKNFKNSPCRDRPPHRVDCSLPQGSCPGHVEFITYTEGVASVFGRHNINHHLFADDKQAYASTPLVGVDDVRSRLRDCTTDISNCMVPVPSAATQLNKTEHAWFSHFGKRSRLNKLVNMEQTVTVGAICFNLPQSQLGRLQLILNSLAPAVSKIAKFSHIPHITCSENSSLVPN